ncbi:MAG: hypothetical protein WBE18_05385 [Gammaproteobacteria bacterium]
MAIDPEILQLVRDNDPNLISLDLTEKDLDDQDVITLAAALEINTKITHLKLLINSIGDEGAQILADVLKSNTTLTKLELGCNSIGTEGVES